MAEKRAVIMDNGSYMTRAGFSGDDAPKTEFLTEVGQPKNLDPSALPKSDSKEYYVGDEVNAKRGILCLKYPVQHGVIDKWEEIEKIWQHAFKQLAVPSEEHSVFLTEPINNPKTTREKMIEIMMEKFNTPAMFIGIQTVLSMYAAGRQTGTALSIGAGVTQITPIDKGFAIPGASIHLNLGGNDLRQNLAKILMESGSNIGNDHAQNMLEKLCYVASDFEQEMQSPSKKAEVAESYELPDGQIITPRDEKFRCPEVLFKPALLGKEYDIQEGIHKMCSTAISKCDSEILPLLYKGMVLSGGSTMFPGFPERLAKEIQGLVPASTEVNIIAPENRKNTVWIGGSILASMSVFKDMWITKEQYGEIGSAAIHKCPAA